MRVSMPDEQVPGVFADFVSVWHTNDVFTFDFAALARPPTRVEVRFDGFRLATDSIVTDATMPTVVATDSSDTSGAHAGVGSASDSAAAH